MHGLGLLEQLLHLVSGHRAILQVKNNKALFPKEFTAGALEDAPGGVHIVLKGKAHNGVDLLAIGYRYFTKTTLFFCCHN
jgi:hypothetical protein